MIKNKKEIRFFIIMLLIEKRVNETTMVFSYVCCYYRVCRNTVSKIVKELEKSKIIKITPNLTDARKKVILPNFSLDKKE